MTIKINENKRTIEVSKSFAKKASIFKSDEYIALKEARNDYPTFKVVTKTVTKRKNAFKGLTLDYMEEYIKEHNVFNTQTSNDINSDDVNTPLVQFYDLCGKDNSGIAKNNATVSSYGAIKQWFLKTFPEFKEYTNRRIVSKVA